MSSVPYVLGGGGLVPKPPPQGASGFSLIEVMVATVVAVIAVLGLAYSFSAGRGLIDRFAAARDAMEAVQNRLDRLAVQAVRDPATPDLNIGTHGPFARIVNHNLTGTESWPVVWVNDPVDDGGPGGDADPNDYKRATVTIHWNQGAQQDQLSMSRSFLGP
jgi:prepilin-type N-terminal cleavage/methylation domain-containing protein